MNGTEGKVFDWNVERFWGKKKVSHACEALEVTSVLDSSSPILSPSAGISSVEWHSTLKILYVESSFQLSLTALSFPLSC